VIGAAQASREPCGRISRADGWLACAVFSAAALVFATGIVWGMPFGKAVVGGLRVLDGDVPYRDFWSMYAPGQFYALAALFWLFGRELVVQGLAAALVEAAAAAILFLFSRRLGASRCFSAVLAAILVVVLWQPAPEFTSWPAALPLLLLAWERTTHYLQEGGTTRLVVAGGLLGVAAWFKHDVAAWATVGAAAGLVLAWIASGPARPAPWLSPLRAVALLAGSAALAALPAAAAVAWWAGADAWQQLIAFPAGDFRAVRTEGFPPVLPTLVPLRAWLSDPLDPLVALKAGRGLHRWVACRTPEVVLVLCAASLLVWRRHLGRPEWAPALLLIACLLPFWAVAHVQMNTHIHTMAIQCGLLAAIAWRAARALPAGRRWLRAALLVGGVAYAAGLATPAAMEAYWLLHSWPESRSLDMPGVRGVRVSLKEYNVYEPIARFVRENVPEDEAIYVGVWRHDAIVITDMRFLFLTGRRSASRHHELHPAVTDREDVQRRILREIESERVRCAVLWKFGWPDERLDQILARRAAALPELGSTLLDEYLRHEFEPVLERGEYVVMWRKGAPRGRRTQASAS
jgi:hypothetical protein